MFQTPLHFEMFEYYMSIFYERCLAVLTGLGKVHAAPQTQKHRVCWLDWLKVNGLFKGQKGERAWAIEPLDLLHLG